MYAIWKHIIYSPTSLVQTLVLLIFKEKTPLLFWLQGSRDSQDHTLVLNSKSCQVSCPIPNWTKPTRLKQMRRGQQEYRGILWYFVISTRTTFHYILHSYFVGKPPNLFWLSQCVTPSYGFPQRWPQNGSSDSMKPVDWSILRDLHFEVSEELWFHPRKCHFCIQLPESKGPTWIKHLSVFKPC